MKANGASPLNLDQALEAASLSCQVDDLRGRGIRDVKVLSVTQLKEIARIALERALRAELEALPLAPARRDRIEERALEDFSEIVDNGVEGELPSVNEASRLRDLMSREERRVRDLVTSAVESTSPQAPAVEAEPAAVAVSDLQHELKAMEERMVTDLSALIERDWRKGLEVVEDSHRRQIEILEARIAKLVSALESTDRVIGHLQRQSERSEGAPALAAGDSGPALDPQGPLFKKKTQLLNALFQANMHLKQLENDHGE